MTSSVLTYTLTNKQLATALEQLAQLMEIHGQNPFRAKAIASAAYKVNKLPFAASTKTEKELADTPGIGASTANKVRILLETGTLPELEELRSITPIGVQEMLGIKGLGPKKIITLWKELGLESLGEVYYACNENRLVGAKGFGLKTQEQIRKTIEFTWANSGWMRYATLEPEAERIMEALKKSLPERRKISFTGEYRRRNDTLQSLEILVEATLEELHAASTGIDQVQQDENAVHETTMHLRLEGGFPVRLRASKEEDFIHELFLTTASKEHLLDLADLVPGLPQTATEEEKLREIQQVSTGITEEKTVYNKLGLQYLEPESREGAIGLKLAQRSEPTPLIQLADLRGALHNHSTYSDGVHSLEEMAIYCKNEMGLEYFGIADHSKSAFYANGLSVEDIQKQWEEIDQLNAQLAPFHIFKGIESDILYDGSLDYPDEILAGFDYVVASIHTTLNMDQTKATERLITAVENPFTTILGHPTGRLLLARSGYEIDHKKVIDACAANQVAIEINANPLRLDLDWRWHDYALSRGVLVAINPDAHRQSGLHDMRYGVYSARKGGVTPTDCLNAFSRDQLKQYFNSRKSNRQS